MAINYPSFNVLSTAVKEKFDVENSSYEPKNMKLEIATSGNKGIIEFWYAFCKVCWKKADGIMRKHRNKLPEHAKIDNLLDNWDVLSISYDLINLLMLYQMVLNIKIAS